MKYGVLILSVFLLQGCGDLRAQLSDDQSGVLRCSLEVQLLQGLQSGESDSNGAAPDDAVAQSACQRFIASQSGDCSMESGQLIRAAEVAETCDSIAAPSVD